MKYKFIIEKTETGYSAFEEDKPIYTTGRNLVELKQNAHEATNLYLSDNKENIDLKDIEFELDFKQFFEHYKVINAKHLAARTGMNETLLSQYVNGIKKPSKKQVQRIVDGLNEIGRELMDISLI